MNLLLPPAKLFQQYCKQEDGWSDHYGALQVAAEYACVTLPERYFLKSFWQHGCLGPWEAVTPGALIFNTPNAKTLPVFVARQEEADFLAAHGYTRAHAIGVPIAYTSMPAVTRIPRSLVVMPTHTLEGDKYPDRTAFERYAYEINAIAGGFEKVTICIHPSCIKNQLWVKEFTGRGFEIIYGAQTNDANALLRMRTLFEQFETVTTNGWGSHLAYALAFGAKVALFGTQPALIEANLLRDLSWSADVNSLKLTLSQETKEKERAFLKDFITAPATAVPNLELGRWLIGHEHRVSPEKMARLLAVLVDPRPKARLTETLAGPMEADSTPVRRPARVLFVCHEATHTDAVTFLLHFLCWFRRETPQDFDVLLAKGGALEREFLKIATVHTPQSLAQSPRLLHAFDLIYSNTLHNADLLDSLPIGTTPIITHLHELDCSYDALGARGVAAVIRQSTHFVANAATAARFRHRFNIPLERFSLHSGLIPLDAIGTADPAFSRKARAIPDDALVVAGCGPLDLAHGADLFVQLAARLKQTHEKPAPLYFVWIGAATAPQFASLLEQDIRKLGLASSFTFVRDASSARAFLATSDVVCLPARETAFPSAMLEAALEGKPIVCFENSGGASEFCSLGGGIAVPFLDLEALTTRVHSLLCTPARRAELGHAALELVQRQFTVEKAGAALWKAVESVIQQRQPARAPRRSLADIYSSWNQAEAPQRPLVLAQIARSELRKQAQTLLQVGRSQEAAQLLIRAVSADLGSKEPAIIVESLVEIGEDLAPIEAKQSQFLFAEAEKIARSAGLNVATYRSPSA